MRTKGHHLLTRARIIIIYLMSVVTSAVIITIFLTSVVIITISLTIVVIITTSLTSNQ